MDQVREKDAEELLDIGVCQTHNRLYECYCTVCYCLICPSCLMFDAHKGHEVATIQQGSKKLRGKISDSSKEGFLKFERTQNVLLDIRHAKLTIQQNREQILKEAEATFDLVINSLKNRKLKFLKELNAHFDKETQLVVQNEEKWIKKQQISQHILEVQKSNDDLRLIENAQLIVTNLEQLRQPLKYQSLNLIGPLITNLQIGKYSVSQREFIQSLGHYIKLGDAIINQYKA